MCFGTEVGSWKMKKCIAMGLDGGSLHVEERWFHKNSSAQDKTSSSTALAQAGHNCLKINLDPPGMESV